MRDVGARDGRHPHRGRCAWVPRPSRRGPGLSLGAFPDTWTDAQVIAAIERVAKSPTPSWMVMKGPGLERSLRRSYSSMQKQ